jgi:hypothetical protein
MILLRIAVYILTLLLIFSYALLTNMEVILIKIGQDPQVARLGL